MISNEPIEKLIQFSLKVGKQLVMVHLLLHPIVVCEGYNLYETNDKNLLLTFEFDLNTH